MAKKVLRIVSAVFILAGLAVAAYPLGLRVQAYLEQRRLEHDFRDHVNTPAPQQPGTSPPQAQEPWEEPVWESLPPTRLEIPALGLAVQVGTVADLDIFAQRLTQPPSYYPQSAMPGAVGNVLIAGHRGGPAGYFQNLDKLAPGDNIILVAPGVRYVYEVEDVFVVKPTQVEVAAPTGYPALTLTTCQRRGMAYDALRLVVRAKLAGTARAD